MTIAELTAELQKQTKELTEEFNLPEMTRHNYGPVKFSGELGVMRQMGRVPMSPLRNERPVFYLDDLAKIID